MPRAFACDYTLVADLLVRVSESFRDLESLRDAHHKVTNISGESGNGNDLSDGDETASQNFCRIARSQVRLKAL